LNLHPGYADVHNVLGLAMLATGKAQEALQEFEFALDLNPRFIAATINAGNACAAIGDKAAACDYYRAALQLDPDNIEVTEKLAACG